MSKWKFSAMLLLVVVAVVGVIYGVYYLVHKKASHLHDSTENHQHQLPPVQASNYPNQLNPPQAKLSEQSELPEFFLERVIDGVTYEIIFDYPFTDCDDAGFSLPYFFLAGRYREKMDSKTLVSWQKFSLYLKSANKEYESIEVILDNWRIRDGIAQGYEYEMPNGVPDYIEVTGGGVLRLRIYHQYKHQSWFSIPEIDSDQLDRIKALAQKKLRLVTELVNIKELKQFVARIERERIEQILR